MHQIALSVLIFGLACDLAAAQRPDTAAVIRPPVIARRGPGTARREAEKRRRRYDFIPAQIVNSTFLPENKHTTGTTLLTSDDEQTNYMLIRRSVSSKPEVHARWDDMVIIRSGTGAIEMGDSLVASTYRAPGERAGGSMTKSHRIVVRAGDIVRIPAAVPHAFVVEGTQPLEYLLIKQRRQGLPIRWFGQK